MNESEDHYHRYLKKRGILGKIYRNYWLYPMISRNIKKDEKVLDIGCGIGDFLSFRKKTYGVDINKKNVLYCLNRGLKASVMEENILPFNDSDFDCIILDNVLEHILDPDLILQEIKRVLVNDGKVIIGVPGVKGYSRDHDHKVFYDESNLTYRLTNSGFSMHKIFYAPFKFGWFDKNLSQYCIYGVFIK